MASLRWRSLATLFALSLAAAACGSTETSATPTLVTQAPSAEAAVATTNDTAPEADTSADNLADEPDEPDETETAAPVVNLFPDIDVLNIADGSTVNLASQLGGGDKATLLWFFAPH